MLDGEIFSFRSVDNENDRFVKHSQVIIFLQELPMKIFLEEKFN